MDSPNVYSLSAAITAAGTQSTNWVSGLDGLLSLSASIAFVYGSGGTACKAYLQTSLDGGATAQDVACAAFTTASGVKQFNVSGLTPILSPVAPGDGILADNSAQDGIVGPMWRIKIVSTGIYGGSTQVVARIVAR